MTSIADGSRTQTVVNVNGNPDDKTQPAEEIWI
jgi:hypothetical protein